jgi:hypothetical protein
VCFIYFIKSCSISFQLEFRFSLIEHDVKKVYLHVSPELQLELLAAVYPRKILHKIASGPWVTDKKRNPGHFLHYNLLPS